MLGLGIQMKLKDMVCCCICGKKDHDTEACDTFVTLEIVNDTFTLSLARLTLPHGLSVSDRVDGSTAVIAKDKFRAGVRFGPMKAKTSTCLSPNINFPLKLFDVDATWDDNTGNVIYSDVFMETDNEDYCNWMCLVSSCSEVNEQNLFCFQMRKELYYLVIKDINVGDELKVWYAPYYAERMSSMTHAKLLHLDEHHLSSGIGDFDLGQDDVPASYVNEGGVFSSWANDNQQNDIVEGETFGCSSYSYLTKNYLSSSANELYKNKKKPKIGKKQASLVTKSVKTSVVESQDQVSYVLHSDTMYKPDSSAVANFNLSSSIKHNSLILDGNKLFPLLLGAKELKSKWKCKICSHMEDNVALHAKHLRSHYRSDEKRESEFFHCKTCTCGAVLTTRKKIKNHRRVCSRMQMDGKCSISINDEGSVAVPLENNMGEYGQHSLLSSAQIDFPNVQLDNTNRNGHDNFNRVDRNSCLNDAILPRSPSAIMDVNDNVGNHFLLTSQNDIQCYNFPDLLPSVDNKRKNKENKGDVNCNNVSISKESMSSINDSLQFCPGKLKFDEASKVAYSNVQKMNDLPDCVLNTVGNIPPILDLADDEIVVFQTIKNFTNGTDDNFVNQSSVDKNFSNFNGKAPTISTSNDNLKQSSNFEHTTAMDFQAVSLMEVTFEGNEKTLNNEINVNNKHETTNISDMSFLDKSGDLFNNLLHDAATGAINTGRFSSNNDGLTATISVVNESNHEKIYENNRLNIESVDKTNAPFDAGGQFQHQLLQSETVSVCENSSFANKNEISDNFDGKNQDENEIPLKNEEYECDICGKKFKKTLYLYRHLRRHTGEFSCICCMAVFSRKETLISHVCTGDKNFKKLLKKDSRLCVSCGQIFQNKSEFNDHISQTDYCSSATPLTSGAKSTCRSYLCEKCGKVCSSKRVFNLHVRTHDVERLFGCTICEKRFTRKDVLNNHLASHQVDGPTLECPVCGKKLKTKKSLGAHMKTHSSSKRFSCNECNMSFHQKVNLLKHLRKHTRVSRHYQQRKDRHKTPSTMNNSDGKLDLAATSDCDAVDVITIAPVISNDVIHLTNNGSESITDKMYKCDICSRLYLKESALKTHKKKVHNKSGNYACQFCNLVFKYQTSLKRHLNKRHPVEKNLPACGSNSIVVSPVSMTDNKKGEELSVANTDACQGSVQYNKSLNMAVTKLEIAATSAGISSTMFLLETDKVAPSVLSEAITEIDVCPSDVTTYVDGDNNTAHIIDKPSSATDYLYYILTPSSSSPVLSQVISADNATSIDNVINNLHS